MIKTRMRWSKELVVEEIKNLHEAGVSLNASYVMENNSKLYGAARKHLGSWKEAIQAAGFNYEEINLRANEQKWDQDSIVAEIQRLAEVGESLNSDYIQKTYTRLHSAAQRYFDSWGDAVDSAGFDYEDIKGIKWTEETVAQQILELAEKGEDLSSSNMQKEHMSLFQAGCRIYNSWKSAVNASGLDYNQFRKQKEWNPQTVLEEIRLFIDENGPASAGLISKKYGALYQAARRNFNGISWPEIVALALADGNNK